MPYYPLSGYKIGPSDLYAGWKIKVKSITGLDAFLNRKGQVSQSWPDADGEEPFSDTSDIYFDGQDVIMFCYMVAATFTESRTLLSDFRNVLETPGMLTLTVPYTTTTYSLLYVGGSTIDYKTPKQTSKACVCEFWIKFRQTTPVRGS